MNDMQGKGEIVVYQSKDGSTRVDVRFEGESVWLTQAQLQELYHAANPTSASISVISLRMAS